MSEHTHEGEHTPIDVERAAIGWRLARAGDEMDAADWAYEHVDDLLAEIARLRGEISELLPIADADAFTIDNLARENRRLTAQVEAMRAERVDQLVLAAAQAVEDCIQEAMPSRASQMRCFYERVSEAQLHRHLREALSEALADLDGATPGVQMAEHPGSGPT